MTCRGFAAKRVATIPSMRAAAFAATLFAVTLPAQAPTAWHTDLDAARQLAAQNHAPLLVVFRCER